jgi:hypothetical protein
MAERHGGLPDETTISQVASGGHHRRLFAKPARFCALSARCLAAEIGLFSKHQTGSRRTYPGHPQRGRSAREQEPGRLQMCQGLLAGLVAEAKPTRRGSLNSSGRCCRPRCRDRGQGSNCVGFVGPTRASSERVALRELSMGRVDSSSIPRPAETRHTRRSSDAESRRNMLRIEDLVSGRKSSASKQQFP